jgi:hypothetical protein
MIAKTHLVIEAIKSEAGSEGNGYIHGPRGSLLPFARRDKENIV